MSTLDTVPCGLVYDPVGELGILSNFAMVPIEADGCVWPSVEHLFQAAKFRSVSDREKIRSASTPADAKALAWQGLRGQRIRSDWDEIRRSVMMDALERKFGQSAVASRVLMKTWPLPLLEDSLDDSYWGIGEHGNGRNMLGELLCAVRERITGLPNPLQVRHVHRSRKAFDGRSEVSWQAVEGKVRLKAILERPTEPLAYEMFRTYDIAQEVGEATNGNLELVDPERIRQAHADSLDAKYAGYGWHQDARAVVPGWRDRLLGILARSSGHLDGMDMMAVGAGGASEAGNLWADFGSCVTLVDWGPKLCERCAREAPLARVLRRRAEALTHVPDRSVDIYAALRTYESAMFDRQAALAEARRVVRPGGTLAISISNAYLLHNGDLISGQIVDSGMLDRLTPMIRLLSIKTAAGKLGFTEFRYFNLDSEIGFTAVAPNEEIS